MAGHKARRWVFTLNNYTEEEEKAIKEAQCAYKVVGREKGQQGTKHLQGYIIFLGQKSFTQAKAALGRRTFIEVAKGSPGQNRDYCCKEGDYYKEGNFPETAKERQGNKILSIVNARLSGKRKYEMIQNEEMAGTYVSMMNNIEKIVDEEQERILKQKMKLKYADTKWRPWQEKVIELLDLKPDERRVYWIYDRKGNNGKSYLGKYIEATGGAKFGNGKTADIAYAYNASRNT